MLESYAVLKKTKTLILNNNKINRIESLSEFFPNLENLSLMNNSIRDLEQLSKLITNQKLRRLYLMNNPIAELEDYKDFIVSRLPQLKVLDFQKIKESDRERARKKFGEVSLESQRELIGKLTKSEKIKMLIEKTRNLNDVNELEMLLKSGELSEKILNRKLLEMGH